MNKFTCTKLTVMLLVWCNMASAQLASSEPKHWKSGSSIRFDSSHFGGNNKLGDMVRREVLDTNTVHLIANAVQLTEHDKTLFVIAPGSVQEEVWFYRLGDEWNDRCSQFADRLSAYVHARQDGNTRACLLAGLTNHLALATISDPNLLILSTNYPVLPVRWFHKAESGTTTNQWPSYTLIDGDIAWRYVLRFTVDGTLDYIHESKCDAKELDPKYQKVIEEVDSEVKAEIKQYGKPGQIGQIHSYWRLKKEKLKARGIDWHSPSELNRGAFYD